MTDGANGNRADGTSKANKTVKWHSASHEVPLTDEIPLHDADIGGLSTQKKIGPLGRKRLRSSIRHGSIYKMTPDANTGYKRKTRKRFGLRQLLRTKSNGENTIKSQSSANSPVRSIFSRASRAWISGNGVKHEDTLDENGLAALHIAAQLNQVAVIDRLIRTGTDVNIKSSIDGATPLHIAARYNCPDVVGLLLQYGADVTDALTNGQTPLHICCRRGYLQVAKVLICDGKADVNSRDKDKTTPLHLATVKGDINICTFLVENGAMIRATDIHNVSPVMQAAQGGYMECVQYLLSLAHQTSTPLSEFLSDRDDEGNTALHLAVGSRHIIVARSLIERGAPVNCRKTNSGFTPLHQAAIIGEEALVQMLIDKGADTEVTDNEQMTPLHRAALFNRVDTILILIRQGLFLDSKDEDNFTPLLCAAWKGQTDAGRALLRYGADITAVDKEMKSCLHWAVELQHLEFTKMLFEHGHGGNEIIEWKDRGEQTALHYAGEVGHVQILDILIKNGADLVPKDGEEMTPLHIASKSGHVECVKVLLQACPVPLSDDDIDDMTPLLLASQNGHHQVVKFLLKMGADIGSRNDDRRSAVALAAKNNEMHVLNVLINNNAKVNDIDKDMNTPLHLCAQAGHTAPTTLLLNSGADLTLQNVYGKYPLDVAIENNHEDVANAILSCKSWEVAMNNIDKTGHTPMRRLIALLPEAAYQVMEQCVTRSHEDLNHPDLKVTYDYRYIDPGPDDVSFDKNKKRYFALETMVEYKREKLLAHKLSQTSLSRKWKRFASYFNYGDLIVYLAFVVLLSVYLRLNLVIANNHDQDERGCPIILFHNETTYSEMIFNISMQHMAPEDDIGIHFGESQQVHDKTAIIQSFIVLFVIARALYETGNVIRHRIAYFRRLENYLHWSMFIPTFFFVYPPDYLPCDENWVWGTYALFATWVNFILVLNRFDFFGLYVTMFFTTLKSLLKAMSVYIFFIVGFALAFFICFQSTNPSFRDEWQSIITTFVMTLGEINKGDLLDQDLSIHPFEEVANILLVIFLFLMPMVLINLTIGISVGDIEQILKSSYFKRFSLQVEIILRTEKTFPRWLQRKAWISKAEYRPNKKKHSFWQKVTLIFAGGSNTNFLLKSKEESTKEITLQDVMLEVTRHDSRLSTLTMMVQQQGHLLHRIAETHNIKVELENPLAPATS